MVAAALLACGQPGRAEGAGDMTPPPSEAPAPPPPAGASPPPDPGKTPAAPAAPEAGVQVVFEGEVVAGGAPCPLVRADDGRTAVIQGGDVAPASYRAGARVRVTGRWIDTSYCQGGPTLQAAAVTFLSPD